MATFSNKISNLAMVIVLLYAISTNDCRSIGSPKQLQSSLYLSHSLPSESTASSESTVKRAKRGDSDVRIAEYVAWRQSHGDHQPCATYACGLVDIFNGGKRSRTSRGLVGRNTLHL